MSTLLVTSHNGQVICETCGQVLGGARYIKVALPRFQPDGSSPLSTKDAIKRGSSSEGFDTPTEGSLPQVHRGTEKQVLVDLESADGTDSDTQVILFRE